MRGKSEQVLELMEYRQKKNLKSAMEGIASAKVLRQEWV